MKKLVVLLVIVAAIVSMMPTLAQEPVTLTMWTWKAFHIPGLEAVGAAFEAETGIKVEFEMFNPDDAYRSKLQTSAQSGELPDIIAYWSNGQWDLAASGLLVDITVDEEWSSSFMPGTFENTSVWTQKRFDECQADAECLHPNLEVGQTFSVPMAAGSSGIVFANIAMLEEAGLDPSMVPANTDEWLDMMTTVYEATGQGITIGGKFQDIIRNWMVDDLALTNCGMEKYHAMYEGADDVTFTDECVKQAVGVISEIAERGLWQPGFQTLTIDEADVSFTQEKAAFLVGGSYTLGFLISQGMDPANIHTFTLPALPTSMQNPIALAPFSLIDLAVTTGSDHPEEALAFMRFFTQPEAMITFAKLSGDLPPVAISTDPEVSGALLAGLSASYSSQEPSFRAGWPPQASAEVYQAFELTINRQVTGEGSLEDDLEKVDAAAAFARSIREGGGG